MNWAPRTLWGGVVVLGAAAAVGSLLLPNLLRDVGRWKHEAPVVTLSVPDRTSARPTYTPVTVEATPEPNLPAVDVHLAATITDPDDTRAVVAGKDALWVATGGGLLRVPYANPAESVHWTTADGLPDHRLTALTGSDRLLVAGTEAGGIVWLDPSAALDGTGGPRVTAFASAGTSRISDLHIDDGALYVGTWGEGVFVGDVAEPHLFRPVGPARGMKSRRITSLSMLEGELFAGTAGAGVWVRGRHGKTRRYVAKGGLAADFVLDLMVQDDRLVAATTEGISRYRRGSWQTERVFGGKVPAGVVRAAGIDTDGALALGMSGGRVGRFGGSDADVLPDPPDGLGPWSGVPRAEVRWLTSGGGRLFAGTERGVAERTKTGWRWWTHPGAGSNDVTSVALSGDDVLVGTFDRGAARRHEGRWTALGLSSGEVNGVHLDADGKAWIGSSHGLVRVDEDGARTWTLRQGLLSNHVAAVRGSEKGLWIGSTGGLQQFDGVGFRAGTDENGPTHIYDVAVDEETVWVGTLEGLWRVRRDDDGRSDMERYRYATGELPDDWINSVVVGADGTLWAGTYDRGIALLEPGGGWTRFGEPDDLPCGWVNPGAMAALPDGSVLVGTLGGGLLRMSTHGLVDHWTPADGLAGDDVTSVAVDGETILVGTRSGLSRLTLEPAGMATR